MTFLCIGTLIIWIIYGAFATYDVYLCIKGVKDLEKWTVAYYKFSVLAAVCLGFAYFIASIYA